MIERIKKELAAAIKAASMVITVLIELKNPCIMDIKNQGRVDPNQGQKIIECIKQAGIHDGVIIRNFIFDAFPGERHSVYCAFSRGTFTVLHEGKHEREEQ